MIYGDTNITLKVLKLCFILQHKILSSYMKYTRRQMIFHEQIYFLCGFINALGTKIS